MEPYDADTRPFSKRYGHEPKEAEITVREDAPERLRYSLLCIANEDCDIKPRQLRDIVCRVLRERPDPNNWSEYPNIWEETESAVYNCQWYQVYDIAEAIWRYLEREPEKQSLFQKSLNDCFRELGIGWNMENGILIVRGSEAFEETLTAAEQQFAESDLATAHRELKEAIQDLSRRPEPDITGAVHHAMGALECVSRHVSGKPNLTLGDIMKQCPDLVPKPLDTAIGKCWGFASEMARHIKEGQTVEFAEAHLLVGLAAVMGSYLLQKHNIS